MGFFDNILLAFSSLKSNKMRSLLTMLGIIIGIAAVIAIKTLGDGMTGSYSSSMSGMGANNITISLTQKSDSDQAGTTAQGVTLRRFKDSTPADADLITDAMLNEYREAFPTKISSIQLTQAVGNGTTTKYGDATTTINATVSGANYDTLNSKATDNPLLTGRLINDEKDVDRMVCVVSSKFVEQTMGCTNSEAIGRRVQLTINNILRTFYVEGVYKYNDSSDSMFGTTNSDLITTEFYIPISVAQELAGAGKGYQSMTVASTTDTDVNSFLNVSGAFFASYYTRNDTWTVKASSLTSLLETLTSMMNTISLGVSAIAAISLLVGGIGVMNIMTVSVTERTREIGTRKAMGAPNAAIRLQFITESMVLCMVGGVIGVILGIGLGSVLCKLVVLLTKTAGFEAAPNLVTILIAVGFSMAIGVFFGYYPANKAAKMNPIDALRYE